MSERLQTLSAQQRHFSDCISPANCNSHLHRNSDSPALEEMASEWRALLSDKPVANKVDCYGFY